MNAFKLSIFLALCSFAASLNNPDSSTLPRPLIVENPQSLLGRVVDVEHGSGEEDLRMHCQSWRFGVETNNIRSWKTVPVECADYVKNYMMKRGYVYDLEMVAKEAGNYARTVQLVGDGNDIWIFDIDETLLSNLPYYVDHGFGLEVFDGSKFDKWVELGSAPALQASLKFYKEILDLGFKVFLLTGRSEEQRGVTEENLRRSGIERWDRLILRGKGDHGKPAIAYKSERRVQIEEEGFRIRGNSGDQWSDLLGLCMANRSFKLPNPMYYID
ncbi:acid phosphatase 1-like [Nymphaea colorata]|nr:acid phosphatase 1-like [Nymphaea colorata]